MIVINNTKGRIEDYSDHAGVITLYGNKHIDYSILQNCKTLQQITPRVKTAKIIKVAPKESDFLYIRNRAVSAGNVIEHKSGQYELVPLDNYYQNFAKYSQVCRNANMNGDFFSHEELKKCYKTFIGKAVFIDHNDENVEDARGIILDAIYNENGYFVELLEAIDRKAFPQLAQGIEKRYITGTSMGCRAEYAICSICGHKAYGEDDLCEHVANFKGGMWAGNLPVFEDNRGVVFFECSIVSEPADPDAKILERIASKKTNNRSGIFVPRYHGQKRNPYRSETNQRFANNRVQSLAEKFGMLPWS